MTSSASSPLPAKPVAAGIVVQGGHTLVARRGPRPALEGLWEFPGGKLEGNETPSQSVVRELAEELAIEVETGEVLAESLHAYPGGAINLIAVLAYAKAHDVSLTVHDAVKWLAADELLMVEMAPADIPIALCGHLRY